MDLRQSSFLQCASAIIRLILFLAMLIALGGLVVAEIRIGTADAAQAKLSKRGSPVSKRLFLAVWTRSGFCAV
jgi:hypothetical protein